MDNTPYDYRLRAVRIKLVPCQGGGKCIVHLELFDQDGLLIGDAPFSQELARKYGRALVRIGFGEDPAGVIEQLYSI